MLSTFYQWLFIDQLLAFFFGLSFGFQVMAEWRKAHLKPPIAGVW
jgi:hypothetical protein